MEDRSIQCNAKCGRYFHQECAKLSNIEFSKLVNSRSSDKWVCKRADCDVNVMVNPSVQLQQILEQVSKLATKDEISKVSTGIENLTKEIKLISDKLLEFEPRLVAAENTIASMVEDVNKLKQNSTGASLSTADDLIFEINDRSNRARNLILYNVPESSQSAMLRKKEDDKSFITRIATAIQYDGDFATFYRLGKPTGRRVRPLKVIFKSQVDAVSFVKLFSKDKVVEACPELPDVSVSRDRTPQEREHLNKLRAELASRTGAGESNLTIRYVNRVPKIMESKNV